MSTVVTVGGLTATSTGESAAEMTTALAPETEGAPEPRVVVDKGQPVDPEQAEISKAASKLGEKGGEAAAKARKEALKAKPIPEKKEAVADGKQNRAADAGGSEPDSEGSDGPEPEAVDRPADSAEPADKRGNPRHDPQARVAQATREAAEARREAAELRARLEAVERAQRQPQEARDGAGERRQPEQTEQAPPKAEDYESYEDFVDARAEWKFQQKLTEWQRQAHAHAEATKYAQEVEGIAKGWQDRLQKWASEDPDGYAKAAPVMNEHIGRPSRLLAPGTQSTARNWIADVLTSAGDEARDLLLHLSEHPQDLQRIAALSMPHDVSWELAKIRTALRKDAATAGTSSERTVSQAKPPVRPVTGSPHTADSVPGDDAPYEQHKAYWSRKDRERQAQR